jgi:AraC-like DNA-binding protein/mannose-6-phosphate isomerase-like protein (cupin superfamily)
MVLYAKEQFLECEQFPFSVMLYPTLPSRPLTPHYHDFIELVYVADGHGEHLYKGSFYPISRGDVFVIPPGAEHDYRVIGDAPLEIYNVMFLPSLLISELEALSSVTPFISFFYLEPFLRLNVDFDSHLKLSLLEGQEVKQRINRILKEFGDKSLGYQISIKALLIELLVFLSRCYDNRLIKPVFHSNESKAIRQVCEFLEQHYAHPLSLEQVCLMCGMSQTTFTVKFKQTVGRTFTDYRNEVRIHASLKQLRESKDKIIHIAQRVGINDLSHFNKLFKHYMKLTPRQYRNLYRNGL